MAIRSDAPHATRNTGLLTGGPSPAPLGVGMILAITTGAIVAVAATIALLRANGQDWWMLLRDPAASYGFAPYAGLFSHLCVLALAVGGAISVFAAMMLPRGRHERRVLLYAGLLSLWLAIDDLFMLHETAFPDLIGLPEPVTLALYVMLALGLIWLIGPALLTRPYLGFWAAGGFLAVMLATDLAFDSLESVGLLVEDTAKLCGFLLWSAFWITQARCLLTDEIARAGDRAQGQLP